MQSKENSAELLLHYKFEIDSNTNLLLLRRFSEIVNIIFLEIIIIN